MNIFSPRGLELKKEQIKKQEEKVKQLAQEIGDEAGINCDWHDNFGFDDAKRRHGVESTLLYKMQEEIAACEVLVPEEQVDTVKIGSTVDLLVGNAPKTYTIGAYGESNPDLALVSYNSPLAQQLMGLKVADRKQISIAGNTVEVMVKKIEPPSARYASLIE